jgi:hypothetical protein
MCFPCGCSVKSNLPQDDFNPLRWLKPGYPTYKEPLTQYPTLLNMTQFGYGRRTCQGQTVTEADLIAALGSIAWLFNISNPEKKLSAHRVMIHKKATISEEELMASLSKESSDDTTDISEKRMGGFPLRLMEDTGEETNKGIKNRREKTISDAEEEDPTLIFTTLLIAKPLPFKFKLRIRSNKRARLIKDVYDEKKCQGEYTESKEYCKLAYSI